MLELKNRNSISRLIGALIGLARSTEGNKNRPTQTTHSAFLSGMFLANSNVLLDENRIDNQIEILHKEKQKLVPRCLSCNKQCGRNDDFIIYDFYNFTKEQVAVRESLTLALLSLEPLIQMCKNDKFTENAFEFLYRGFYYVGDNCDIETILPLFEELSNLTIKLINSVLPENQNVLE